MKRRRRTRASLNKGRMEGQKKFDDAMLLELLRNASDAHYCNAGHRDQSRHTRLLIRSAPLVFSYCYRIFVDILSHNVKLAYEGDDKCIQTLLSCHCSDYLLCRYVDTVEPVATLVVLEHVLCGSNDLECEMQPYLIL